MIWSNGFPQKNKQISQKYFMFDWRIRSQKENVTSVECIRQNPSALNAAARCVALVFLPWLGYVRTVSQKRPLRNGKIKKQIGKRSLMLTGSIRFFVLFWAALLLTITKALLGQLSRRMDRLVLQLLWGRGLSLRILCHQPSSPGLVFRIHDAVSVDESFLRWRLRTLSVVRIQRVPMRQWSHRYFHLREVHGWMPSSDRILRLRPGRQGYLVLPVQERFPRFFWMFLEIILGRSDTLLHKHR